ncbi:MAG: PDDEXK nuclease domain-containing protein [bacterium]|jgi:predicted nuclease of restriction endonuclease-like (RecB) superfamily|nr:PDDEXK nuclease domain-containing protein [bacterium]
MKQLFSADREYNLWVQRLKQKIRSAQIKAALSVNTEMLNFYWELGTDIVEKQKVAKWGDGFLARLSDDLMNEFPGMKGFSLRNIKYIRQWFLFYSTQDLIGQQAVAQIMQQVVAQLSGIPWGHNITIISKCKNVDEALFYVQATAKNNWSRSILTHQIEGKLFEREGKAITNFQSTLPVPQSDLAVQTLKDPYIFDFMTIRQQHDEKELEDALISHVTKFLLELGAGFSYIGRQYKIEIDGDEFFIDLLFYHVKLHCYVVVELKTVKFQPEFAGKLNFYVSAIDGILKTEKDDPTIGILICKSKNNTVVEYSIKDINKPIGVSRYNIVSNLEEKIKSSLQTIEEIEKEMES